MRGQRTATTVAMVILAGVALAGCQANQEIIPGEVLATYEGGEITLAEFDTHLKRQVAAQESLANKEGDWRVPILEELALREIVAESASRLADPELEAGIVETREEMYQTAMTRRLGWDEVSVTDEQVRQYYDDHPDLFVNPEKLRLQHIFLRSETDSGSAAERAAKRDELERIREQVVGGADFAAMAKQHSDSADGPAGGWMILKRGAKAIPAFIEAVWALEPDEVSEVINTPAGFHIARLAARIPAVERPFEDVRDFATTETRTVTRRRLEEEYLAEKGPGHDFVPHYERLTAADLREDTVLFSLDGEDFTVLQFLAALPPEYLPHFFGGYQKYLPRILDQLALGRVLLREAAATGVTEDEALQAEVAAAEAAARASAEIDRRLVLRSAEIPEDELRDHYEQNKERFETLRRRSISMIRLPPEKGRGLWELLKEGERIAEQIRAGADFADMARKYSHHVSVADGGRLINQTDDELRLRLQARARGNNVLNALELGEVSKAFIGEVYDSNRLQFEPAGVFIVRLDEEFPPRQAPFEEVEELVRANYLRRYYSRFLSELREAMLAEAKFTIIESNLPDLGA